MIDFDLYFKEKRKNFIILLNEIDKILETEKILITKKNCVYSLIGCGNNCYYKEKRCINSASLKNILLKEGPEVFFKTIFMNKVLSNIFSDIREFANEIYLAQIGFEDKRINDERKLKQLLDKKQFREPFSSFDLSRIDRLNEIYVGIESILLVSNKLFDEYRGLNEEENDIIKKIEEKYSNPNGLIKEVRIKIRGENC